MINPLDMMGPQFLGFYIVYGIGVFLLAWLIRFFWERAQEAPMGARWSPGIYPAEGDAYTLALLRGGPREVAVTVLGRLMAEGFFLLEGETLRQPQSPSANRSRLSPLEQAALDAISPAASSPSGLAPPEALSRVESALEPRMAEARRDFESAGLVPGDDQRRGYRMIGLGAILLVTGLGAVKLLVAVSRGRSNVGILVVLLAVSVAGGLKLMKPPARTTAGERYLKWLRESHQGLVQMVSSGRRPGYGELALVAAIFGVEMLPGFTTLRQALIPPPPPSSNSGSSCSSSGSSCSSGSGCGGGCGGGGCGGCGG
jgi:uncharacterized protein (TIGR04222 family)